MTETFTESALERLRKFLKKNDQQGEIETLTPDASTREYFRIGWNNRTAVACIYPEPFRSGEQSYLDVTNLFLTCGLPVARIFAVDEALGIVVQEDLGNRILRDVLVTSGAPERDDFLRRAIRLIADIQAATPQAFALNSIASRLSFDFEKLSWELDYFTTHYFETFRQAPLERADAGVLKIELDTVAAELAGRAKVLTHRDFHAANLMLDRENRLRIIDHQDARLGSVAYDLVSLLLDRVTVPPTPEWLAEKRRFFLAERESLGLEKITEADFAYEFRLQTIQRCLKAIGTFSFQSASRGKTHYVQFINPMFEIVLRAAENLGRFPHLQQIIKEKILAI